MAFPKADDSVIFNGASPNTTVDLNGTQTIQQITFAGSTPYTLTNGTLNLGQGITYTGNAEHNIDADVHLLGSSADFNIAGWPSLSITGAITGTSTSVDMHGGGALYLRGDTPNTFGNLSISGGWLWLDKTAGVIAIPGNLAMTGGYINFDADEQIADSAEVTISNGIFFFSHTRETIGSLTVTGKGVMSVEKPTAYFRVNDTARVQSGARVYHLAGTFETRHDLVISGGTYRGDAGGSMFVGDAAAEGGQTGALIISDLTSDGSDGGHVLIQSGGRFAYDGDAILGNQPGESGWAVVDGEGSGWTNHGDLYVGKQGHGSMVISNRGSVLIGDFAAILTYGANMGRMVIAARTADGSNGGHIFVQNGGKLVNEGSAMVGAGFYLNTNGWVSVTGAGSEWSNAGSLSLGVASALGMLTIEDGGKASNSDCYIGSFDGFGTATVSGSGSTWDNTSNLTLGERIDYLDANSTGKGILTVNNGGTVFIGDAAANGGQPGTLTVSDSTADGSSGGHLFIHTASVLTHTGSAILGDQAGESGWANVDGNGSIWDNTGDLYVGASGAGTLSIKAAGSVTNANGIIAGVEGAVGEAVVIGVDSTWRNLDGLYIGGNATTSGGAGSLTVTDGGRVFVGRTLKVWQTGTVRGDGEIVAAELVNAGLVKPGQDPVGVLTLTGDYTQEAGGRLAIGRHANGLTPGVAFDWLDISGSATLDGELVFDWGPAFYDGWGFDYVFLTASGGIGGSFSSVDVPENANVVYGLNQVSVTIEVVGDLANHDGYVGIEDLNVILSYWNQTVPAGSWAHGDTSGDGFVGIEDLNTVLGNWNAGTPPGDGVALIPEPGSVSGLIVSGLALLRRGRR